MRFRHSATVLFAGALLFSAGCGARQSGIEGAHIEGGYGTPFYAEVPHAAKEGQKPRIYLFGKIAHYEKFLDHKDVPENAHKKYIGKGVDRATIVVQDLVGMELKENPTYTDKLLATYRRRHASALAAQDVAVAPAAPAATVAPAAPAAMTAPAAPVEPAAPAATVEPTAPATTVEPVAPTAPAAP